MSKLSNSANILPSSIEETVDILIEALSREELDAIKNMNEDDLLGLHMNLGQGIRNSMGLWGDNKKLLKSCGNEDMHPDNASSAIVKFLWLKIRH